MTTGLYNYIYIITNSLCRGLGMIMHMKNKP